MNHGPWRRADGSRGQVLVWLALLVVVLMCFVGLAVDGGTGLAVRRRMQNAADAGALAGAHELCFGSRANAVAQATTYALRNGAEAPVSVEIRNRYGQVDQANGHIVWVQAGQETNATLLRLLGLRGYIVHASASAACGIADTACGLWPLTFSDQVWHEHCGEVLYVWNAQNEQQEIDCAVDDCDLNGDGIDDIVTGSGRGWVDFSDAADPLYPDACTQTGCGASEMSCQVQSLSKNRIILPACLPGVGGVRESVVAEAIAMSGRTVKIPVFDGLGCDAGRSCPNGASYHVTRFGCAVVEPPLRANETTCTESNGVPPCYDPRKKELVISQTKKAVVIRVETACSNCETDCGRTTGAPPPSDGGAVVSVSLLE